MKMICFHNIYFSFLQTTPLAFKYIDVLFFNYERPVKISVCFSVDFTY